MVDFHFCHLYYRTIAWPILHCHRSGRAPLCLRFDRTIPIYSSMFVALYEPRKSHTYVCTATCTFVELVSNAEVSSYFGHVIQHSFGYNLKTSAAVKVFVVDKSTGYQFAGYIDRFASDKCLVLSSIYDPMWLRSPLKNRKEGFVTNSTDDLYIASIQPVLVKFSALACTLRIVFHRMTIDSRRRVVARYSS